MTPKERSTWRYYVNGLRKRLPPGLPVKVKTCAAAEGEHACLLYPNRHEKFWLLKIGNHLDFDGRIDSLLHEWTHCLVGERPPTDQSEHHSIWGVYYAKVYRVYEQLSEELEQEYANER